MPALTLTSQHSVLQAFLRLLYWTDAAEVLKLSEGLLPQLEAVFQTADMLNATKIFWVSGCDGWKGGAVDCCQRRLSPVRPRRPAKASLLA